MTDSKKTIFNAAKRFLSGTLISRVTGLMRDVAMAFAFGTEPAVAALMVAFRFAHLFRRLLGEGALQMSFIPKFESLRKESSAQAFSFYTNLAFYLSAVLILLVALCMAGLGIFSTFTSLSEGTRQIVTLTMILMPSLLFICLYGLNCGLLQCEKSYFIPSVAPVAFNLFWIAGAVAFRSLAPDTAMPWMAGMIAAGCAAQWAVTLPKVRRIMNAHSYTLEWKKIFSFSEHLKRFLKPLLFSITGIAASQINNALDPLFARYADSEGPAFLWYAIRLEQFPLALFGIALSGALLPPLARAIQAGDMERYKTFLDISIRRCLMFMIPMSFAYLIAGDTCVNLLFGHGDFSFGATIETTQCLWAYTLGLIPSALILIMAPGFYSLEDFRTPTLITSVCVAVNIFLNSIFVGVFGLGAASVALATSLSAWVNAALLCVLLQKRVGTFFLDATVSTLSKTALACIAGSICLYFLDASLFDGNSTLTLLTGHTPSLPRVFHEQLGRFLAEATAFGLPVIAYWRHELRSEAAAAALS